MQKPKKSAAKRAGVKTIYVLPDGDAQQVKVTSFGKGQTTLFEKTVDRANAISHDRAPSAFKKFEVEKPEGSRHNRFSVQGRGDVVSTLLDPRSIQQPDLLNLVPRMEARYFEGAPFRDNMHRQVCSKIVDIEKNLAFFVNNVVFCLNAFTGEQKDLIGALNITFQYGNFSHPVADNDKEHYLRFLKLCANEKNIVFPAVFSGLETGKEKKKQESEEHKVDKKKEAEQRKKQKEVYHVLSLIGMLRQVTAHGEDSYEHALFADENKYIDYPAIQQLNRMYEKAVTSANRSFFKNSEVDLQILFHLFGAEEREQQAAIVRKHYAFVMRKEQKNIGLSVKHLRESMVHDNPDLQDKKHDSYRRRLYRLIDYLIFDLFTSDAEAVGERYSPNERAEAMIVKLRGAETEVAKDDIYRAEAKEIWKTIGNQVSGEADKETESMSIVSLLAEGEGVKKLHDEMKAGKRAPKLEDYSDIVIPGDAHLFSKYMWLMTLFLDGKEINDLLSTMTSLMESIQSLLNDMAYTKVEIGLKPEYIKLEKAGEIASDLRLIQSFAKMQKPDATKPILFVEAARLLGTDKTEEQLKAEYHEGFEVKGKTKSHNNFLVNNVVVNNRFLYMVKYMSAENVRALTKNSNVVSFVVGELPDTQVVRYWNLINRTQGDQIEPAEMRKALVDRVVNISFAQFDDAVAEVAHNKEKYSDNQKEQDKALISFYLTIAFQIVKNLVLCNSRYYLAFRAWEMDMSLAFEGRKPDLMECILPCLAKRKEELDSLTGDSFNAQQKKTRRQDPYDYLLVNAKVLLGEPLEEGHPIEYPDVPAALVTLGLSADIKYNESFTAGRDLLTKFRADVEHLDAVRRAANLLENIGRVDSYFAMYQYAVQKAAVKSAFGKKKKKQLQKLEDRHPRLFQNIHALEKYKTYNKDLAKLLCMPFAYRLPRYNNLSMEGLFDRNRPGDDPTKWKKNSSKAVSEA